MRSEHFWTQLLNTSHCYINHSPTCLSSNMQESIRAKRFHKASDNIIRDGISHHPTIALIASISLLSFPPQAKKQRYWHKRQMHPLPHTIRRQYTTISSGYISIQHLYAYQKLLFVVYTQKKQTAHASLGTRLFPQLLRVIRYFISFFSRYISVQQDEPFLLLAFQSCNHYCLNALPNCLQWDRS